MTETFYAERLGWIKVIRDGIFPSTVKLVGFTIATYANKEDGEMFPSQKRLVAVTQLGETTVRKSLKHLRDNHLLWRVSRGSNLGEHGVADTYRLILPKDYKERFKFVPAKGAIDDPDEYRPPHQREPRYDPWATSAR